MIGNVSEFVDKSIRRAEVTPGIAVFSRFNRTDEFDTLRFHLGAGGGDVVHEETSYGVGKERVVRRISSEDFDAVSVG